MVDYRHISWTGTIYVNEVAPRPHNSGHYTIEACYTSQYENHLRAILGLPLGDARMIAPSAVMLNLIGTSTDPASVLKISQEALAISGAHIHLYGKTGCRKGRKMGHITLVGESDAQCRERLRPLLQAQEASTSVSEVSLYSPTPVSFAHSHPFPLVSIIMGSDSDLPVMRAAATILNQLQVPYELTIVSAHRTPERMVEFAKGARGRGMLVQGLDAKLPVFFIFVFFPAAIYTVTNDCQQVYELLLPAQGVQLTSPVWWRR